MSTFSRLVSVARQLLLGLAGLVARSLGGSGAPAGGWRGALVAMSVGALAASCSLLALGAAPASADSCPNAQFRTGYGANLPDCRAYEQATPINKDGTFPMGGPNAIQASPSGEGVTFYTQSGVPGGVGAAGYPMFMAGRSSDSWFTTGLMPPQKYGQIAAVLGWSPDLSSSFSSAFSGGGTAFLRQSSADHSIETIVPDTSSGGYYYVGASSDGSKVYFEATGAPLTADAAAGEDNLYEWDRDTGKLSLVGVLPASAGGSAPVGGSFAGPYDWFNGNLDRGGAQVNYYTQANHAISDDGGRVYFTDGGGDELYLRENPTSPNAATVEVSASQKTNGTGPGGTDPAGPQPAAFMAATPDGSHAFFTSPEELTNDANTGPAPTIGRANLDGTGANQSFLPAQATGIAVDGSHIYWADPQQGTIGRANLDGTGVDPAFITGASSPRGVAVDGSFVYWTNAADGIDAAGTIGRANLDGIGVNQSFIAGANNPHGIAVDGSHIYWANAGGARLTRAIGRANLDGSGVNQSFISVSGAGNPAGIAVDSSFIYYTSPAAGQIGRANLDGTGNNRFFITGASDPQALAVDGSHIYWANSRTGTVGRSDLDGSNPDQSFIAGMPTPLAVAVDASHVYWASDQADQGNDLYRYDAATGQLTDLTPDSADPNGAQIQGVLGTSDDGSYVYFAANGDLDGNGPATAGDCSGVGWSGSRGTCSLYLWHDGTIKFIAQLEASGTDNSSDAGDWAPTSYDQSGGGEQEQTARVTPDGRTLLFRSQLSLTGYDNSVAGGGNCTLATGSACTELYRYRAGKGQLQCVSCDPSGAAPVGSADLQSPTIFAYSLPSTASILTRNLSSDGNRVFFESPDPLVARDGNSSGGCPVSPSAGAGLTVILSCQDVYEWEADGAGSCQSTSQDGGCLYLLSTGSGANPAFFGDASASGDDVFLFSDQQLVPGDQDQLYDIYDARVDGGLASQNQTPVPACTGEACQGQPTAPPGVPSVGSVTFSGPGNSAAGGSIPASVRITHKRVAGSRFTLTVRVPGGGRITASGAGIRTVRTSVARAGSYKLTFSLSTRAKKTLARKGKLAVSVRVVYAPAAGGSSSVGMRVNLRQPSKHRARRGSHDVRAGARRKGGIR